MTQINLYKIQDDAFYKHVAHKYEMRAEKTFDGIVYRLFAQSSDEQKDVSWKWLNTDE